MKSKLYEIRFKGSWLGGKSVVKAINEQAAWKALQKKCQNLEPIEKCRFKELEDRDGVIYFDSGEY